MAKDDSKDGLDKFKGKMAVKQAILASKDHGDRNSKKKKKKNEDDAKRKAALKKHLAKKS